jgi:uncharacterized membrane protein YfcA
MTVDWANLALAVLGLWFAGIVKGATGIGYASCALPFLTAAVGLKQAIVLVVLPAMVSNILVIFTTPHLRETLQRFWLLYLATLPGTVLGIALLVWIDQRLSTIALGLLIIAYALFGLAQPSLSLRSSLERQLQFPVGLVNGFLTGLTGSQVLPLVPYILALHIDADRTVQAINLAITITSAFLMVGLYQSGVMSLPSLGLSVVAILPAMAGIHVGTRARSFIPVQHFRTVVQIVLGLLGLVLVAKQLF